MTCLQKNTNYYFTSISSISQIDGRVQSNLVTKFAAEVSTVIATIVDDASAKELPRGYQPNEYDVICGRGKGNYNQPGNQHFRDIVFANIEEYQTLKTKIDKTTFLNKIIEKVRAQNGGNARFVKRTGPHSWEELGDDQAREKVGHAIREALAPRYKPRSMEAVKQKQHIRKVTMDEQEQISERQENLIDSEGETLEEDLINSEGETLEEDIYEPLPVGSTSQPLSQQMINYFFEIGIPSFAISRESSLATSTVAV